MNEKEAQLLNTLEIATKYMAAAVTRCSRDLRYLWANQAYANWIQRPLGEIADHPILEVLGKDAFEVLLPHFNRVLTGGTVRYEQETNFQGIGSRWISAVYSPTFDGDGASDGWVAVVLDITSRKIAEAALRDSQEALRISEERLRLGQWAAHIGTFDLNLRTGVDIWTPETEALYGLPPGSFGGTLTAFENLIHPDDRERVIELTQELIRTRQPVEAEWRTVWPDGSVHWIAGRGQVFMDESGEPSRMLGVNMDITERKQAEEALSAMTWKLVEAQEQERARIARELHDDINQRLALLAIELSQLQNNNDLPAGVRDRMDKLQQMASEISMGVHNLSHELHFATLDYLGLVSGMRSWCEEYGARQKLEIDFKSDDVPTLPQDTSLCLFRVLQEALHNAAKYSGVKRIEVQLTKNSGEIHLIVSDSGRGFDVEAAKRNRGLGLTSMQERVRLVGGTIAIDSKPLAGTTVHVCVPCRAERDCQNGSEAGPGTVSRAFHPTSW